MRVVQVINHYGFDRGGAERLARGMHDDLISEGVDAHLVEIGQTAGRVPKNAISLGFDSPRDPRATFALSTALKSLSNRETVVHGHLFPTTLHLSLLRRTGRLKSPLTMTEHNTWNRRRDSSFGRTLDRMIYSQFDRIVSISDQTRDALVGTHPQVDKRTKTIRNGAELRFSEPMDRVASKSGPVILTVARLARAKNIETALHALSRLVDRPWRYVVAGDGVSRAGLEALAVELGISSRVEFLGQVEDVTEVLRGADIFFLPSLWEGFGLAAVEAMNACLPVVASDVPGLREIVSPAGNPVVDPLDAEGFADALKTLLGDPEKRMALGRAGFEHARGFDKSLMAADYVELWRGLRQSGEA